MAESDMWKTEEFLHDRHLHHHKFLRKPVGEGKGTTSSTELPQNPNGNHHCHYIPDFHDTATTLDHFHKIKI